MSVAADPSDAKPVETSCRPVHHVWDPKTEPLRLPCQRTIEPCDGVDNDADGILDPHCPTISCTADADCTFDGLVPDADCDDHNPGGPSCKPIDGNGVEGLDQCRGVLCPPGLKCYAGDCSRPGTASPGAPCETGLECPINSGCIPNNPDELDTNKCVHFCHDAPCPTGFACVTPPPGIEPVSHSVCHGMTTCPAAKTACEALETTCLASDACPIIVVCRRLGELLGLDEATCKSLPGATAEQLQLATDMASCDAEACPTNPDRM